MTDAQIVLVTVPDADKAAEMARALVDESLVACVNIVPGVRSIYRFEGRTCDDAEVLCVMKTRRDLYPALRDRVTALHPYRVPEIVAIDMDDAAAPYLAWLMESTQPRLDR